jgi:hypothetical protein
VRSRTWLPVALDTCCVLAFVVIGRASHAKGEAVAGVASTAWPFLSGMAIGWLLALAWHHSPAARGVAVRQGLAVRQGVVVWLATVAAGMALRVVAGQGTAIAFVAVALVFLGLFLLGWRTLVRYLPVIPLLSGLFLESFRRVSRNKEFLAIGIADIEAVGDAHDPGEFVTSEHFDG